jgi:hypothetical protein
MTMTKEEWKKHVLNRILTEIMPDVDKEDCAKQIDAFVSTFSTGVLKGHCPPHRRYEVWTRAKMENEIMKQLRNQKKES